MTMPHNVKIIATRQAIGTLTRFLLSGYPGKLIVYHSSRSMRQSAPRKTDRFNRAEFWLTKPCSCESSPKRSHTGCMSVFPREVGKKCLKKRLAPSMPYDAAAHTCALARKNSQ